VNEVLTELPSRIIVADDRYYLGSYEPPRVTEAFPDVYSFCPYEELNSWMDTFTANWTGISKGRWTM